MKIKATDIPDIKNKIKDHERWFFDAYFKNELDSSENAKAPANFHGHNLQNMLFEYMTLSYADFSDANLSKSVMKEISVEKANFKGANLEAADLTGCYLKGANFSDTNLNYVSFYEACLCDADFTNANLEKADLQYADLRGAKIKGANFNNANLILAKLPMGMIQVSCFNEYITYDMVNDRVISDFWRTRDSINTLDCFEEYVKNFYGKSTNIKFVTYYNQLMATFKFFRDMKDVYSKVKEAYKDKK